jgi:hypothetical protein
MSVPLPVAFMGFGGAAPSLRCVRPSTHSRRRRQLPSCGRAPLGHSDANLTAKVYTDVPALSLHTELAKLPWLGSEPKSALKTPETGQIRALVAEPFRFHKSPFFQREATGI